MIGGNILYYVSGVVLAFALKDYRAFCKYLWPITAILKINSRFALLKIEGDKDSTTVCPEGVLDSTFKLDIGGREILQRK